MSPAIKTLQILLFSGLICILQAHLNKTSLSISGDESYEAGEKVEITWKILVNHYVPHYIYFSSATGEPWELLDSVPEQDGNKSMSYTWTVPQTATTSARIRIFQSLPSAPGKQTDDYTLISGEFTIVVPVKTVVSRPSLQSMVPLARNGYADQFYTLNGRVVSAPHLRRWGTANIQSGKLIIGGKR